MRKHPVFYAVGGVANKRREGGAKADGFFRKVELPALSCLCNLRLSSFGLMTAMLPASRVETIQRGLARLRRALRRHGAGRLVLKAVRLAVFPRGSARDAFWCSRLRPIVLRLTGQSNVTVQPQGCAVKVFDALPPVNRMLLIKPDHIGDFLLALPAFALLRRSFPAAQLTLLCGPWNAVMAERVSLFDVVIPVNLMAPDAGEQAQAIARRLALPRFDLAIDLRVDPDSRELLGAVPATCKAGFSSVLGPRDMVIELTPIADEHEGVAMLRLAATVVAACDPHGDAARLWSAVRAVETPVREGPLVVIGVGSGRAIKNWPAARFAEVAAWLIREHAATVVLVGTDRKSVV